MEQTLSVVKGIKLDVTLDLPVIEPLYVLGAMEMIYTTVFPDGQLALVHLIEEDDKNQVYRQIIIPMTPEKITQIKNNEVSLLSAYECDTCYIVDTKFDEEQLGVWSVKWRDVDKSALPVPGVKLRLE